MITIGSYTLNNNVLLAPMAGVTDRVFRKLCRDFGAALAPSEMVTCDTSLYSSRKSQWRLDHTGEIGPRTVQIAGGDADMLAQAAIENVSRGAQMIDINMGCPAKKVCNKAAGSALLQDEALVAQICEAVVKAVAVPVTLKIRTGWHTDHRNACNIAHIAEDAGIKMLTIHGRTRSCGYKGDAEYDTIARVKQAVSIPVIANGDITTAQKAKYVLDYTQADGIMIGRGAQGRPWIFREVVHYLQTGEHLAAPDTNEIRHIMLSHLSSLHDFYGEYMGVRIARKHIGWYMQYLPGGLTLRKRFNTIENAEAQLALILEFFDHFRNEKDLAA